jgi:hypothetical protein
MHALAPRPHRPRFRCSLLFFSICGLAFASFSLFPPHAAAQEQKGAGLTLAADADTKDVGLPLYPGSRRHKDKDNDSPGANFGMWGAGSGFKMAILKMESDDSPEKVAAYYKKALAKYGKVLDCSNPSPRDAEAEKNSPPNSLTCGDDKPDKGALVFKSGTEDKQHIVAIQPNGNGSLFQLLYLANWGNKEKK